MSKRREEDTSIPELQFFKKSFLLENIIGVQKVKELSLQ